MNEKEFVCPGDSLGVIEEFTPNQNCFEVNGEVYSSSMGQKVIDKENHQISIQPTKKIFTPRRGSIALGYITEIRRQSANMDIEHFKVGKYFKDFKCKYSASLSVSNLSNRFVKNMYDGVRPGDWVICKIAQIEFNGSIEVSLYGSRELGVVSASCFVCAQEIDKVVKRNLIRCSNCGATQPRILSSDFPIAKSLKFYIK